MTIAALDPGRDKCGVAVLADDSTVLWQNVINTENLIAELTSLLSKYQFSCLIEGNGTTSKQARCKINENIPQLQVIVVDEYRTTEMAKKRYWQANPPRGWRRLLPVTMQVPPQPVDDFVAVILGERYLAKQQGSKKA